MLFRSNDTVAVTNDHVANTGTAGSSSSNSTDIVNVATLSAATRNSSSNNNNNTANEIYNVYIEIMSSILKQLFRTYSQQLLILDYTKYHCTKNDVIAIDANTLRESVTASMMMNTTTTSTTICTTSIS